MNPTAAAPTDSASTDATPTSSETVIARARGLVKTYGAGETAVRALDGIDVDFARARLTAIMGPSGSGKSTLMHCLAGLDRATSGSIVVDGAEIGRMNERQLTRLRRTRLGFVFQAYNLVPTLTAAENITLPLDIARVPIDRAHFDAVVAAEPWSRGRPSCSPTNRPGTWTRTRRARSWASCAARSTTSARASSW